MKKTSIRIAGVGGQGIKFAGEILGEAAILNGYYASQRVSYTAAARGGPVHTDLIISDAPIRTPILEIPNIFCIMAQYALEYFKEEIKASSSSFLMIVDDNTVRQIDLTDCLVLRAPFSTISRASNMVLIGFLARLLSLEIETPSDKNEDEKKFVYERRMKYKRFFDTQRDILWMKPREFENAIGHLSPQRFKESNLEAFHKGYELTGNV